MGGEANIIAAGAESLPCFEGNLRIGAPERAVCVMVWVRTSRGTRWFPLPLSLSLSLSLCLSLSVCLLKPSGWSLRRRSPRQLGGWAKQRGRAVPHSNSRLRHHNRAYRVGVVAFVPCPASLAGERESY